MISAPFHPVQTADNLPTGFRFEDFGNNRRGFVIEASTDTDPRCITQRICVPQGETRSIRGSYLVQSTVQSSSNGYEGIGQDVQCLVRNGTSETPLRTYHNDVFRSGKPELLINDTYSQFTMINFIDQIPYDVGSEFVDVSLGVRGNNGELRISSALLRNHYADHYVTVSQPAQWTSFSRQYVNIFDGRLPYLWNHFIDTHSVRIAKNQEYRISIDGFIYSALVRGPAAQRVPFTLFVVLKMRRLQDQGYDYIAFAQRDEDSEGTFEFTDVVVSKEQSYVAENAYDQVEVIMAFNIGDRNDIESLYVGHSGLKISFVVGEPTQTGG